MSKAEQLRRIYEANIACGDIGEAEEARMLARISAAEQVDERDLAAA
jgi:hypothetical protein